MKPVSLEVTMMKIIGELKAENERLKAEYTHKDGLWTQLLSENHRIREAARFEVASLKAEVERLTFDPLTYLDDQGEWMPRHTHLAAVARLQAQVERLKAGEQPTEWRHYRDGDTSK